MAATTRLTRWRAAVSSATGSALAPGVPAAEDVLRTVRERLAEDLDAPGALAAIDTWADAVLAAPGSVPPADARLIRDTADALLGIAL
jgi:L-cysteine:1D-myo-inositol 2-amino-2-deoxy-alpha-D-glucopyranoside ligase